MSNLIIVTNNLTDKANTLSASSTAGSLSVNNLKTEFKTEVHRSTGTSVTYTLTWSTPQKVGCVALPCTNLSSTATMRVRLYSDTGLTSLIGDTGTSIAHVTKPFTEWLNISANTFPYGGYTKAARYFSNQPNIVRAVVIDLVDTTNPTGFIDCSRIVCGEYWSPRYNFQSGVSWEWQDSSSSERTMAGDFVSSRGYAFERLTFDFSLLPQSDRDDLVSAIKYIGSHKNVWVSLIPLESISELTNSYSVYGRFNVGSITQGFYKYYNASVSVESW